MKKIFLFSVFIFAVTKLYCQCNQLTITGENSKIEVRYDKDGRLHIISGTDEEGVVNNGYFATNSKGLRMLVIKE
ncbi:MAG: hypothetical protein ABJA37_05710 [Ferruginibacter sp.]